MNNMTREEQLKMVEEWIEANDVKRYAHGERPEGTSAPSISVWARRRRSPAETQAAKDAEE